MKKQNRLINLSIIGLLWLSLAFACNNGDRGKTTSYDTTPVQQTSQNTNGELTEQIVKDYFTNYHMKVAFYKRNIDANGIGQWAYNKGGIHYSTASGMMLHRELL